MSLDAATISAAITWNQSKTNSGFSDTKQGPETLAHAPTITVATYNEVFLDSRTIAAGGSADLDLYSFTSLLGASVTATKIVGILLKGTGSGAQMRVAPATTDPLTWFWGGTTPTITLNCGSDGCSLLVKDGSTYTMTASVRKLTVSNPGGSNLTLKVAALVGT